MRRIGRRRTGVVSVVVALVLTGSAWAAFQPLPPGGQVNDDSLAGIDPARGVDTANDPANSDVTGGSLTGGVAVPWAIFRAHSSGADQIFERSFANGAWTTRGHDTLNGRSDSTISRPFGASLNFDQTQDGEAPSTDFAGTGRTVPWATWYELTTGTGFANLNIFASRFDLATNTWVFAGQGRGNGGAGPQVPSLNIHTDHAAENPSVAGGTTVAGNAPSPWVTWQEVDGGATGPDQIFVSKAVKPVSGTTCPDDGARANKPVGVTGAIGGFCWQQVGLDRISAVTPTSSATGDPTLNVDPTRDGIEPDIAFTGANDTVPWVVWYEVSDQGHAGTLGLHSNDMVFAAKATANAAADGQFQWTAVGTQGRVPGTGVLDTSGTSAFGDCSASAAAEESCSLNVDPTASAVDPRVAAGTMTAGNPTVPWVAWEEASGGHERIFVSRLVGSGAAARFVVANGGQPLPTLVAGVDATRPDITFSGTTPYVSWHEGSSVVYGHFATPDAFVIDNGAVGSTVPATVRAPISSGCTANPFNLDGTGCQAGAIGTPFFLFTDGSPAKLLADAYQPDAPITGAASGITSSSATVSATVNPQGGPVHVRFDFGPTTSYGSSTTPQALGPVDSATSFSAALTGLAAGSVVHYRAVAVTDFGTFAGNDQALTTTAATPTPTPTPTKDRTKPKVRLSIASITIKKLLSTKKLRVTVRVDEASRVTLGASTKIKLSKRRSRTITLGTASVRFTAAGRRTVTIKVGSSALRRLKRLKRATIRVTAHATDLAGNVGTKTSTKAIKRR